MTPSNVTVWLLLAGGGIWATLVLFDTPGRAEDINTARRMEHAPALALAHTPELGSSTAPAVNTPNDLALTPADEDSAPADTFTQRKTAQLVRDAADLLAEHPRLARELFALAAKIEPRNPHAHAGCAAALLILQKPAAAQVEAEAALRIRPKRASYRALLESAVAAQQRND